MCLSYWQIKWNYFFSILTIYIFFILLGTWMMISAAKNVKINFEIIAKVQNYFFKVKMLSHFFRKKLKYSTTTFTFFPYFEPDPFYTSYKYKKL